MKKTFKTYAVLWAILLVVFNVICFVTPREIVIDGVTYNKFGGAFWSAYIFITFAFIGQLICAGAAFKAQNLRKLFYNIPIISVSYTGLVIMFVVGALCMAIPNVPNWVGIVVCVLILAFTAVSVIKASAASDVVEKVDEKLAAQTHFIKTAVVKAQGLIEKAKTDAVKAECRKIYEALRYSDPMSNPNLALEEEQISSKIADLANAVGDDDIENVTAIAGEIVKLANDRNNKCKVLK